MAERYYKVESMEPMKSLGFLIKRCGVVMSQLAESRFQSQDISFTQWLVLIRLSFHDHLSATRLSEEMGHDMGALTRVVDALERGGFVRRERSQRDRRAVEIAITADGRHQVAACMSFVVELLNELVEPFSKSEIETLIVLLQRLLRRLMEVSAAAPPPPPAPPARDARKGRQRPAATSPATPRRKRARVRT